MRIRGRLVGVVASALLASGAFAGVPANEAAKLGASLTPIGAERAGNAAGTIPEWTGGIKGPPGPHAPGAHYQDPFAGEKALFTITGANAGQYGANLSEGQKALLAKFGSYKLPVYPSHRTCAYPDFVYAATKQNAVTGSLAEGGNGVQDALMGFPFPIPQVGVEVIWNHNLRYRGYKILRQFAALAPTTSGDFTPIEVQDEVIFKYTDPTVQSFAELDNVSLKYIQQTLAPARRAGNVILVYETINQVRGPRQAWQYSPGTRRVRRAPNIEYDNPQSYSDGLQTSDNFDLYNGSPDRYEWTLGGKREMYLPYNAYEFGQPTHKYADIAKPGHLNQDMLRYELHRAWVVEGKLKPDARHIYSRRTMYFDEDSWTMALSDLYDGQGALWRTQEGHMISFYDVPLCGQNSEVVYDLQVGRYVIQGVKNEMEQINFNATELNDNRFTPQAIRNRGR